MTEKKLQKDFKESQREDMFSFIRPQIGLNSHKRYLVSLLSILFFTIIGGTLYVFSSFIVSSINPKIVNLKELIVTDPLVDLFLSHFVNIFGILGIWFAARTIHKRSLKSFITTNPKINWKRVFFGFTVFFVLMSISQIIDMLFYRDNYQWNDFDASRFIWLLVAVIFLIPIQTTSEELLFRGFLLQWIGKLVKQPILLALIVGFLFGALHFGNPEMSRGAFWVGLEYVFVGFMLSYVTIRTNSAEFSIGAHAANNMFLGIFLTEKNDVWGDIPSLFVLNNVDAMSSTIHTIVITSVFFLVAIYYHKKEM